jgi:hypothetical protein
MVEQQVEQWRPIADYDKYEVSNMGNVRRTYKNGKVKLLKPQNNHKGYLQVCLHLNGKPKLFLVHRLVAFAFIELVAGKLTVDHIDRDPSNNNVENLRFADYKEQNRNTCRYRADIEETDPKIRQAIIYKERYEANKETILDKKREHYEANKEILKVKAREHYEANKETINAKKREKKQCECGAFISSRNISAHRKKSKKHQKFIESQNE